MQPYPPQDDDRLALVVEDIGVMLHDTGVPTAAKITRWITKILSDAASRRAWWFLKNVASATLAAGNDIVDLKGDVDTLERIYCPRRLNKISLARITDLRMAAAANGTPNGGPPTHYALEAGRRVHLWPCPSAAVTFAVLYQRPFEIEILPTLWDVVIADGVIGRYGRHFDRDQLTEDPVEFERRYESGLKRAAVDCWDVEGFTNWEEDLPAQASLTADSSTDTATDFTTPASLTGIGHECIYTLVVP